MTDSKQTELKKNFNPKFDRTSTFTKTKELEILGEDAIRIDLDQELYTIDDFGKFAIPFTHVQVKSIRLLLKPLALEGSDSVIYGVCFSGKDLHKVEEMAKEPLKYFRRSNEQLIFDFDTYSKKTPLQSQVVIDKDLFISAYFKPIKCLMHLEYHCIFS